VVLVGTRVAAMILSAAVLIAGAVGLDVLKRHDDESECKKYQLEFHDSLDRFYYGQDLDIDTAVLLTHKKTHSYRPPGCPVPVPSPRPLAQRRGGP
jgi:hypothetical protein